MTLYHLVVFASGDLRLSRFGEDDGGQTHDLVAERPVNGMRIALGCVTAWWDDYGWARRCVANGG